MLFTGITMFDEDFNALPDMYVGVKDDKIGYVGAIEPKEDFGSVYNGRGKLLMPAFCNAHSHSAMTLLRGYGENMNLQDWLNKLIFPFEAKMGEREVYAGTLLAMAESIRFGIVSSTDMYYYPDGVARAVAESGAKMNIGTSVLCFDGSDLKDLPIYKTIVDSVKTWQGAENGRIKVDLSVHAEYTSTEKICFQMAELASQLGTNMHIHANETKLETEECRERRGGRSVVRYLADCGLLDVPATLAHCVWASPEDMDIMKEKGATAAVNPISNLKLASGTVNLPAMMEKGLNIALGTDGVSSNNCLNILEDAKILSLSQKVAKGDPAFLSPAQILKMMTRNGFVSQGRMDSGLIKEGYKADLVVMDFNAPHLQPVHSYANNVIYSANGSDICLTMCDGKVLYKDGEYTTIDIEKAIAEVNSCTARILKEL